MQVHLLESQNRSLHLLQAHMQSVAVGTTDLFDPDAVLGRSMQCLCLLG